MKYTCAKLGRLSLFLLALSGQTNLGCGARLVVPEEPRAPAMAKAPVAPKLPSLEAPQPPAIEPTLGAFVEGVPAAFPVPKSEVMVVAIPEGAVASEGSSNPGKATGTPSAEDVLYRYAFITGFLRNGYAVKDGGIIVAGTLNMRRYPATETERSETVKESSTDGKVTKETKTTSSTDHDWWWWSNTGLSVGIKDPTSLWAPELLQYQALKAQYYLRIFRIDAGAHLSKNVPTKVDAGRYSAYVEAVRTYNNAVAEQQAALDAYEKQVATWLESTDRYKSEYADYVDSYSRYITAVDAYNLQYPDARIIPNARQEFSPPKAPTLSRPSPSELLSREQLTSQGLTTAVSVRSVSVLAEVIQISTGRVVWAGRLVSVGDADHARLLSAAVDKLVAQ